MHSRKLIVRKLFESSGILFAALIVFAAITYALTTWSPGTAPTAGPGDGNVEAGSSGVWDQLGSDISYVAGKVGIGTTAPAYSLDVSGASGIRSTSNIYSTAFIYSSDESQKENIQTVTGIDVIKKLRGVSFNWKDDGRADIGLIAQEVEQVLPEIVHTDSETGLKSVEYGNLVAPLIEAVKEQQKQIEALQQAIKKLQ
ncbi:MAG: tail fiber domain-containing protein [Candidatus Peribacteraceae bacterium]|nr:tail fiber domain-containing protein [Candidatus Peribacteraceae bacterium]